MKDIFLNVKEGVVFKRITQPVLRIIREVLYTYTYYEEIATITSANDSTHMKNSLHYKDLALDFRIKDISKDNINKIFTTLKNQLGIDYDVILESDHIHIEYQPKF